MPRKGQSGVQAYTVSTEKNEGWELIRIEVFTKDLEDASKYCTEAEKEIKKYDGTTHYCSRIDVVVVDTIKKFMEDIIPTAIQLHSDRLLVRPVSGKLRVPKFADDSYCKHFTVPEKHRTEGVENADFVLYVAAGHGGRFGVTCAVENSSGRPIVGAVNYVPQLQDGIRFNVRRIAQEIAHALGFDHKRMKEKGMLSTVELRGAKRKVVISSKTVEKAQKHYNCSNLKGMELKFVNGEVFSYWDARNAKDELMSSARSSSAGYYTTLTMALFEDLQYYKANWGMEEQMSWGNQSGCDFLQEKCMENNKVRYPQYFCNETISGCTSDRTAYGKCNPPSRLNEFFEDNCEVTEKYIISMRKSWTYSYCTGIYSDALPGSIIGPDSWCLDAEELKVNGPDNKVSDVNGVCARVLCDYEKRTVKVQYKGKEGENDWYECPENGTIVVESSAFEDGGKIKCPKYD
ncbi:surface protease GP63, partial [Trypanosoma theileri]